MLITPRFLEATQFIPWIVLAYLIRAEADFFRSALFAEGRVAIDARLNWIVTAVCLGAYALFIPRWQAWGAIAATMLAFVTQLLLSTNQALRKTSYRIETGRVMSSVFSTAAICVAALWLQSGASTPVQWALALAAALGYPALLFATGFFLPSERSGLRAIFARIRTQLAGVTVF